MQQLALFRGINVGGKNSLPMKQLVEIFIATGADNVRTYIQSGNVVFESSKPWGKGECEQLAAAIKAAKGFSVQILILSVKSLNQAISLNPYPVENAKALHFYFLASQPKQPDIARLDKLKKNSEHYHIGEKVLYLLAPEGIGRSKLAAAVESALGVVTTARNYNTVEKLSSLLG